MKTIHQHLSELPEPHRTNCIEGIDKTKGELLFESMPDVIFWLIDWNKNPYIIFHNMDAMDYWEELHDSIVEGREFNA